MPPIAEYFGAGYFAADLLGAANAINQLKSEVFHCRVLAFHLAFAPHYVSGAGFTNDLRETLTYGELLKHEFYPILRTFG